MYKLSEALPKPYTEVLVLIDSKRGPFWSNNYWMAAYMDNNHIFWEQEREDIPHKQVDFIIGWTELPPLQ